MTASPDPAPTRPQASRATENVPIAELLRRPGVVELLLAALTFLLYCGTLAFKFVYDDRMQIIDNASIRSWSYLPSYFTGNVWHLIDARVLANYYRPLFLLWLRINDALFGLDPTGWHATTVAFNVLVTVQVYWLGKRLLPSPTLAALSAVFFAVHPVHIESASWVSGATDPMLAVFLLASVLAYLKHRECAESGTPRKGLFLLSLLFAALALLSKEIAVMLPLLLVLSALATRRPSTHARDIGMEVIPFFLLDGAYLLLRASALKGFSHPLSAYSWKEMFFTWPSVIAFYARQLLLPLWISPYANVHWVESPTARNFWLPLAACLALTAVAYAIWSRCTNRPRLLAIYGWIVLPLLPALYIKVFSVTDVVHDRYLYLSSIGYSFLVLLAFLRLSELFSDYAKQLSLAGIAVLVVFAFLTFDGEMYWASDLLLFRHALAMSPDNDAAMVNLGIMYIEHGRYDEGSDLLRRVTERNPGSASAAYNYAHFLFMAHRDQEAETYFRRALSLDPSPENWWIQYAGTELRLGKAKEATAAARQAIQLKPSQPEFHVILGLSLATQGDRANAEAEFREALRLDPRNSAAAQGLRNLQP